MSPSSPVRAVWHPSVRPADLGSSAFASAATVAKLSPTPFSTLLHPAQHQRRDKDSGLLTPPDSCTPPSSPPAMPSTSSPSLPLDPSLSPEFNRAISLSLSSALASATHAEQVNSAKLLSVSQLQDYDQFRGMVAGAHLRAMNLARSPLDAIVSQGAARGTRREVGAIDRAGVNDGARWVDDFGTGVGRGKEARLDEQRSAELLRESRTFQAAAKQPTTRQTQQSTHPLSACTVRSQQC